MKVIILIMILGGTGKYNHHTIIAEFNSLENCQQAAKSIAEQAEPEEDGYLSDYRVMSWGCYQK